MATPATRKVKARRPFAVVTSLSAARNRVMPPASDNVVVEPGSGTINGVPTFAQCLHRFRKFSAEQPGKPAVGRVKKCGATPVPAARTPKTRASRRRLDSSSRKVLAPVVVAAASPYDAPRAPLWDFSDENCQKKIRARLSSPSDGSGEKQVQQQRRRSEEASRKRTKMSGMTLEEAMAGLPEPGEGRVRYLVDTFERLLLMSGDDPEAQSRRQRKKRETISSVSSAPSPRADEMDMASYPSAASSSEVSCAIDFSRRNRRSSARDERQLRRCNSIGSSERCWSKKTTTSQHPFNLRTEQRGRVKEDNFVQKMRMLMLEEERLRNPIARGLPLTTDEPENITKPPAKEPTEPDDVMLHSAFRAVGRARFDHLVAERNNFLEKLELEKERQQKMDEEFEIKQLRKELVPKAHRMPDFSKPFVPKRSVKPQTVPKEPRFHPRLMRHDPKRLDLVAALEKFSSSSSSSFSTRKQQKTCCLATG